VQEFECEVMPMDMDIFILCLWFMFVHSTKYYCTLIATVHTFSVFSTSAGFLE
jgi:hypothetical protein